MRLLVIAVVTVAVVGCSSNQQKAEIEKLQAEVSELRQYVKAIADVTDKGTVIVKADMIEVGKQGDDKAAVSILTGDSGGGGIILHGPEGSIILNADGPAIVAKNDTESASIQLESGSAILAIQNSRNSARLGLESGRPIVEVNGPTGQERMSK